MDEITYINGNINYRGYDYSFNSIEKVDDDCVHILMGEGIYAFLAKNTTINGISYTNSDEIINLFNI